MRTPACLNIPACVRLIVHQLFGIDGGVAQRWNGAVHYVGTDEGSFCLLFISWKPNVVYVLLKACGGKNGHI